MDINDLDDGIGQDANRGIVTGDANLVPEVSDFENEVVGRVIQF